MGDPQMPAEHLPAIPALETNHMIVLYRPSNRNSRLNRPYRRRVTPEIGESSMHLDDQRWELVGCNLVMPHVAAHDPCDTIGINLWCWWWCVFSCHCAVLTLIPALSKWCLRLAIIRRPIFFCQPKFFCMKAQATVSFFRCLYLFPARGRGSAGSLLTVSGLDVIASGLANSCGDGGGERGEAARGWTKKEAQ
jgi:hypothetical protein